MNPARLLTWYFTCFFSTAVPFREPVNWRELGLDDYPKIVKKPMALSDVKAKLANGSYRSAVSRFRMGGGGGEMRERGLVSLLSFSHVISFNIFVLQAEAAEDVQLIWANCMAYNMDGSDFYKLAAKFQQRFDEQFAKVSLIRGRWLCSRIGHVSRRCPIAPVYIYISNLVWIFVQIKQGAEDEGISEVELDRPPTLEEQTQFAHNIYMIKSEVRRAPPLATTSVPPISSFPLPLLMDTHANMSVAIVWSVGGTAICVLFISTRYVISIQSLYILNPTSGAWGSGDQVGPILPCGSGQEKRGKR